MQDFPRSGKRRYAEQILAGLPPSPVLVYEITREAALGLKGDMQLALSDSMISEFLSGLFAVFALIAVGGMVALILGGMARRFPFTRLAIILALAPLSLVRFLERGGGSTLFLFAMIVILLGITIDGINYLLTPKIQPQPKEEQAPEKVQAQASEADSGVIVWEKAE